MSLTLSTRRRTAPHVLVLALSPVMLFWACGPGGEGRPPPDNVYGVHEDELTVCPVSRTVTGIDVSHWQGGSIDWKAVKGSGKVDFAYTRASYGLDVDETFAHNWSGMKAANLPRGAYVYFRPSQDAQKQAELVVQLMGKGDPLDLPPVIDVEEAEGVGHDALVKDITAFLERVQALLGKKPIIYSGYFWTSNVYSSAFDGKYLLWVPNYGPSCPGLPTGWNHFAFWQYADNGLVPGIPGGVDHDLFNGTIEDLRQLMGAPPAPATVDMVSAARMADAYQSGGTSDLNGDGKADVCARGAAGISCFLSDGTSFTAHVDGPDLLDPAWADPDNLATLRMADINGDGKADLCGRANAGFRCWISTGQGFVAGPKTDLLSDAKGWDHPRYFGTIRMADINGDGKADLCARGKNGIRCWLSNGHDFVNPFDGPRWSDAAGFDDRSRFGSIRMGDINGDGKADVCAFNGHTFVCYLSNGRGFPKRVVGPDVNDNVWVDPSNWATFRVADVNGDGKADLCGRNNSHFRCWLSQGTSFKAAIDGPALPDSDGWDQEAQYGTLRLAEIYGDGDLDLCGRTATGVRCWRWLGSDFGGGFDTGLLLDANGFDEPEYFRTLRLADVTGDGKADLCVRRKAGLRCYPAIAGGFSTTPIVGPDWSDATGWNDPAYYPSIRLAGP